MHHVLRSCFSLTSLVDADTLDGESHYVGVNIASLENTIDNVRASDAEIEQMYKGVFVNVRKKGHFEADDVARNKVELWRGESPTFVKTFRGMLKKARTNFPVRSRLSHA